MLNYEVNENKVRCTISGDQVATLVAKRLANIQQRLSGNYVLMDPYTATLNRGYSASATVRNGDVDQAKRVACRRAKLKLTQAIERKLKRVQTAVVAYHNALTLELMNVNDVVQHAGQLLDEVCE